MYIINDFMIKDRTHKSDHNKVKVAYSKPKSGKKQQKSIKITIHNYSDFLEEE